MMTKPQELRTQTLEKLSDDPELSQLRQRRGDLERERRAALDERRRAAPEGAGTVPFNLAYLEADGEVKRLEAALTELDRQIEIREREGREQIVAGRGPKRVELLRRLLDAAEAGHRAAGEVRQYDEETAGLVGLAPGEHPLPVLLGLPDQLDRLRRLIDPPAPPRPKPAPAGQLRVRPGQLRVHLVERVIDRERVGHILYPGDVADFDADVAKDLLQRKLAVPVA